jgi:hypothetical protein
MPQEAQYQPAATADLYRAAEAVARSGRKQEVKLHGTVLTIARREPLKSASRRRRRRENGFLAAYGSVPPLNPALTDTEMTEIAGEEAAQEAARAGLPPHADH